MADMLETLVAVKSMDEADAKAKFGISTKKTHSEQLMRPGSG